MNSKPTRRLPDSRKTAYSSPVTSTDSESTCKTETHASWTHHTIEVQYLILANIFSERRGFLTPVTTDLIMRVNVRTTTTTTTLNRGNFVIVFWQ